MHVAMICLASFALVSIVKIFSILFWTGCKNLLLDAFVY